MLNNAINLVVKNNSVVDLIKFLFILQSLIFFFQTFKQPKYTSYFIINYKTKTKIIQLTSNFKKIIFEKS